MTSIPHGVRHHIRFFAFIVANGSLRVDEYGDLGDYRPALMEFGSPLEQLFAVFTNVLQLGPDGEPVNSGDATRRAAQYLRGYLDRTYEVTPPFEDWELELH